MSSFSKLIPPPDEVNCYGTLKDIESSTLTAVNDIPEVEFLEILLDSSLDATALRELVSARLKCRIEDDDATRLSRLSVSSVALRRMPAIVITVVLELAVGFVVSLFSSTIKQHPEIVSFMPLISSVCGNIGLQSSAATLRASVMGITSHRNWQNIAKTINREIRIACILAICVSIMLFFVVWTWTSKLPTGLVSGSSILVSSVGAAIMGSMAPLIFKSLGFDPAMCAGPFETALQDIVGIATFLSLASTFL